MNLDQFYNDFNGKASDYDGAPSNDPVQCVDLVKFYLNRCFGINPGAWGDAHQYFNSTSATLLQYFDRVTNNPNDPNQTPKRGDIIIWSASQPGSGGGGHIDICWSVAANGNTFVGFDQNWGGKNAKLVTHNWSYVLGWLTPKGGRGAEQSVGGIEMIQDINQARQAYNLLRPDGNVTDGELNGTAGKRSWQQFANDAQAEVNARNAGWVATKQQLSTMQNQINQQNQAITDFQVKLADVTASNAEKQAALDAMMNTLAETNAELATAHDKIQDLSNSVQPEIVVQSTDTPKTDSNVLVKLLTAIFSVGKKKK